MAITREQRQNFNRLSEQYKLHLDDLAKEQSGLNGALKQDAAVAPYVRIRQAMLALQRATLYCRIDALSQRIQGLRSDTNVNTARKEASNAVADLLKITRATLDMTLTDNQEILESLVGLDARRRLHLVLGCREVLDLAREAEGPGKYRWYFAELYMNLTTLALGLMDFKLYERAKHPEDPGYDEVRDHLDLLIEIASIAAREYRQKFEMAGKDVADLQKGVKILEMLRMVYQFSGNREEASKNELNLTSMKQNVEAILKKQKQAGKTR